MTIFLNEDIEELVHYVTRSKALPSEAEHALGSKSHTIFYARDGRFLCHSGSVWYNISKSWNIWGGDFYRTWTVKLMNCACANAGSHFYRPSTVKIPTPNIPRFANVTKQPRNDTKNVLQLHKDLY